MDRRTEAEAVTADGSSASARLPSGSTLNDRYVIEEPLGSSPYGEDYRARDLGDSSVVRIRAIHAALLDDPQVRGVLEREIQIATRLDHKNIGATFGLYGAQLGPEAISYLALEAIDGQTLREMMDKKMSAGRPFSVKGAYNVVAHLCNALAYAHATTAHGGLCAQSIRVNSAGRVKVCDFGLPRALPGVTPDLPARGLSAEAPELASAGATAISPSADLYAVGVILFELVTGRPPRDAFERASAVMPGLPPALDGVIETCLRENPRARFADAQSLKEAVQAAVGPALGTAATRPPANAGKAAPAAPATPARAPAAPSPVSPPRPAAATQPPRQITKAPISESFNLDSALTGSDDGAERWLIQKDKLDFGPFSMREVRSQIESGKIVGEHVIVDTENGERRKVKDHPALRQLALDSEVRQAEQHRMDQESSERRTHKRRVVSLLGAMFVVVLGAGGGAFWYLSHMKPEVVTQVIHDQADLDFLKGVRIVMKVDSPAHHGHSGRHHAAGHGGKNAFDDVTRLGDASQGGSEETLDQSVVQRVMSQNWRVLVGCIREERHRNSSLHDVNMDFIIKGSGQVSAVRVNGQTGTAFAGCMYGKMQSVTFPKFNGDKTHASFSLALK